MKQFKIFFWAFIFVFLSCSFGASDQTEPNNIQNDVTVESGNSLLWRIEGEGVKISYLYGTMHIIDAEYYHFTEKMIEKIKKSDAIIMEMGGMPNPLKVLELMSLDTGDIKDLFSDDEMKAILSFFDTELGTDPNQFFQTFGKMKPFFILQSIIQHYFSDDTESYDLDIMGIAEQNKIPLIGLETMEEQLGFFDIMPQEAMNGLITETIDNFEREKKRTLKMMKLYAEQKVDKLIPLIQRQPPELMEYSDVFLYNRNKDWIPKIKKEMESKRCFIAVGAAHLFGDGGLIDLLEKEGLLLTAVPTDS